MFHIVLFEPEIPPNTGNIIRLCANTGCQLHLVKPLGFDIDDRQLRRAGLDYHEFATVKVHENFEEFIRKNNPERIFMLSTKGKEPYSQSRFKDEDTFVFGPETRGLPDKLLRSIPAGNLLRIPMKPGSRSLNLSNSVAIIAYEAWRQTAFYGCS